MKSKYLVGIDEAGRGPLAGPVAVGAAVVPVDFDWETKLPGVNDSKKLTEKKREVIFALAKELKEKKEIDYVAAFMSAKNIDAIGIVPCIKEAIKGCFDKLSINPEEADVKLDGGLVAPEEYLHQETIIKGDSKEAVIGLASVIAKVMRDQYMYKMAKNMDYLVYEFETHKGYGTKKHREAIAKNGLSPEHRRSYCKNIKMKNRTE